MVAVAAEPQAPGSQTPPAPSKALYTVERTGDGTARLAFHFHPGQTRAWDSERRFVWMLAGSQGGKTSFGPLWLWREMQRRGPGDYLAVTATYPLLKLKMLPEFLRLFEHTLHLGTYHAVDKVFTIDGDRAAALFQDPAWRAGESRVIFGSGINPEGLESATAKAAWLDECGQDDFKLESYEAVRRRLSLHRGRILGGTTIYNLGWLKQQAYDAWKAGDDRHDIISFPSIQNPLFPRDEYEHAQRDMPTWKFAMFYKGEFARPGGLIFEDYNDEYREYGGHKVRAFPIPHDWPCYVGIDFGAVNTAVVWLAREPSTREYFLYRELHGGQLESKSAREHVRVIRRHSGSERIFGYFGGAKGEKQFRLDWKAAGIHIPEPEITEVEVGIEKVIDLFRNRRLFVFDQCRGIRDELGTYARRLDETGEPTEAIKDKERYHRIDSLRYVCLGVTKPQPRAALAQTRVIKGWGR